MNKVSQVKTKQPLTKHLTKERLDIEVQRLSLGFYPDRQVQPILDLPPEERMRRAKKLAEKYEQLGLSSPPALLILL